MNRGSFHTRRFRCVHLSVLRYRLIKNVFAAQKTPGVFEKRVPAGRMKADKRRTGGREGGVVGNQYVLILTVCYSSEQLFTTVRKTITKPSDSIYSGGKNFERERPYKLSKS